MQNPTLKVQHGQLRGINEKNINGNSFVAFRGVPYAKPPVGDLRFKDCEPLEPWSGVRNATKFSDRCAQQDWTTLGIVGSDDCLYLNIYTASLDLMMPKAVMVWIHGGSFICGSGEDIFFGPDYLIEKDIVLVTINYRVGILGFLNVEDEEAPGNQGLKDQVQALKWVHQNIAQFGGDPKNVTIFGHSAGGASVHYLTLSPLARGLFHKAIIQSGVATNSWASSPKPLMEPERKLATLLKKDISNVKEFVKYLRTLDAHELVRVENQIQTDQDRVLYIFPFIPTVDSKAKKPFLTKPVEEAAKAGIKVPCICGYLSHEGMTIIGVTKDKTYEEIDTDSENLLIHPTPLRFLKQHNVTVDDCKRYFFGDKKISPDTAENFVDIITATHFNVSIDNVIEIQTKMPKFPMYVYTFEYNLKMSIMKKFLGVNMNGTCHGDELSFLFFSKIGKAVGMELPAPGSIEHRLIQRFTEMWTNFAKTSNPTPRRTELIPVIWKPIDNSEEYKCLKITDKLAIGTVKNMTKVLIESKKSYGVNS